MLEFHSEIDLNSCNIFEDIDFLMRTSKDPRLHSTFSEHITNTLIKAREEKLKLPTSIPRKLEDGWILPSKLKSMTLLAMLYVMSELVPPLCQRDSMIYLI